MVNLGLILGGETVTLEMVSRIDVREGVMWCPVMVWSQYLRFYRDVSKEKLA